MPDAPLTPSSIPYVEQAVASLRFVENQPKAVTDAVAALALLAATWRAEAALAGWKRSGWVAHRDKWQPEKDTGTRWKLTWTRRNPWECRARAVLSKPSSYTPKCPDPSKPVLCQIQHYAGGADAGYCRAAHEWFATVDAAAEWAESVRAGEEKPRE